MPSVSADTTCQKNPKHCPFSNETFFFMFPFWWQSTGEQVVFLLYCKRTYRIFVHLQVQIDVESFVSSFRPDIMEAVYAWAKGSKFYEVMEITQVFEGSLIRAIRRLEEVLQQLILAAKSIGERDLELKFEEAVSKIKRDIVFAASLYL